MSRNVNMVLVVVEGQGQGYRSKFTVTGGKMLLKWLVQPRVRTVLVGRSVEW